MNTLAEVRFGWADNLPYTKKITSPFISNMFTKKTFFPDNTLHFWKYPEDENRVAPSEQISLHECFTELPVPLAPREVCSRLNTFMLESKRRMQHGDRDALNMQVVRVT